MFYVSDLFIIGFTYLFTIAFENAMHKASHHKISGHINGFRNIRKIIYYITLTYKRILICMILLLISYKILI